MHDTYGWGTWTADRPAEVTHLATGLRLTPVLYSDRAERASDLPPGALIRYGNRGLHDGHIAFRTLFEDTALDWRCDRDRDALTLSWTCRSHGEWGLRYWVCLAMSGPPGASFVYDPQAGTVAVTCGAQSAEARFAKPPLLVTVHRSVDELIEELQARGYFYLGSRGLCGPVLALRFNLDEAPDMAVHLSFGAPLPARAPAASLGAGAPQQQALQAVHDVLAWNHVYDPVNARPYTALTRNWSQKKFGGFGVWLNDVLFHALMWAPLAPDKARQNVEAVFAHQTDAGNFPCLVTGNDAWLDRSQLPMASFVVWTLYRVTRDREFLRWAFPKLLANHRWWWAERRLGETGLVAYGTSAGQGDGLYKGTKLAAKNESAMDNSAVHDEAAFDPVSGLLQSADVGVNALLALDGEVLAQMARILGAATEAEELEAHTAQHKARIGTWLWDGRRSVFANRLRDGRFVDALAPTSFYPMVAGLASEAQVASLVTRFLESEDKFGGTYALPSAARDQPAFHDNTYWRGRVWAPLNYWVYLGLRRYGRVTEAQALAKKSLAMFNAHWSDRVCGENYNAVTGAVQDQPDTDPFYTWGALLAMLSVLEVVSETPWDGLTLAIGQDRCSVGPVLCSLGAVDVASAADGWQLSIDGRPRMSGSGALSLATLNWSEQRLTAWASTQDRPAMLRFPGRAPVEARLDGAVLAVNDGRVTVPPRCARRSLDIVFDASVAPG